MLIYWAKLIFIIINFFLAFSNFKKVHLGLSSQADQVQQQTVQHRDWLWCVRAVWNACGPSKQNPQKTQCASEIKGPINQSEGPDKVALWLKLSATYNATVSSPLNFPGTTTHISATGVTWWL